MHAGRVLHYEIVRALGRGGMGEVAEALDTRLHRRVALKFVAPELAADPDVLARFEREAHSAAGLTHPHIAVVHAFESGPDGPFLVMELLTGGSVRDLIRAGALPVAHALRIARETASALAFAHAKGIVHRDVKPENVMFDEHGTARLTDFGLAHTVGTAHLTRPGTTLGTAAYMSPEAARGSGAEPGDVFSLGVMLHEMLAGSLPFAGEHANALRHAIESQPPRPLTEARPDAGDAVAELVASMLAKPAHERPRAEQVVRRLDQLRGAPSAALPDPVSETQPLPVLAPGTTGAGTPRNGTEELSVERLPAPWPVLRRPRRVRAAVVLLALVVLGAALAYGWNVLAERAAARRVRALAVSNEGASALLAGDHETARRRYDEALRLDPRQWRAMIGLAAVEQAEGDPNAAAHRLTSLAERLPRAEHRLRYIVWSTLARIATEDGNWPDALANSRRAFAEDSSDAVSYNDLGYALLRTGRADSALAVFRRAVERFPGLAPLHKNVGLAALTLGDLVLADSSVARARAADPGYAPAWALAARLLARRGERDPARREFARALASGLVDSLEIADARRDLAALGILE